MRLLQAIFFLILLLSPLLMTFDSGKKARLASVPPPSFITPEEREEAISGLIFEERYEGFLCEFEHRFNQIKAKTRVPGAAVAIVKDGKIIYQNGFGVKKAGEPAPVEPNTLFRIASVSKGFAAVLAGLLVHENKLTWDDNISQYLPKFETNPIKYRDSLLVRHVLSHSTGYQYQAYSTLIEDGLPLDTMLYELQHLPLSRKPGEIHAYQNVAYSLIEKVVEDIEEKPYQALLEEKIFEPLDMYQASADYVSLINSDNAASPHRRRRRGYTPTRVSPTYYNVAAAGGINASITDMGKWLKAMMGYCDGIIPPEVLDEVFEPQVRTSVKNRGLSYLARPRKGHYALGWRVVEYPTDTVVYHEGYANGFRSAIAFKKNRDAGICILTNSSGRLSGNGMVEFFKLYDEWFPETTPLP